MRNHYTEPTIFLTEGYQRKTFQGAVPPPPSWHYYGTYSAPLTHSYGTHQGGIAPCVERVSQYLKIRAQTHSNIKHLAPA
jgi:hypothetical protein